MRPFRMNSLFLPAFLIFFPPFLLAQIATGIISGTVSDETGAVLPGRQTDSLKFQYTDSRSLLEMRR